jgi:putative permease
VAGRVGRTLLSVGSGVFSLVVLLVLVIYTVGRPEPLVGGLLSAVSERYRGRTETALRRCLEQLTRWGVSSLILGVIVAGMTGGGLWLLGMITGQRIPSILMLSVIAGIGELVPNLGPLVSAVPAILLAATVDPMLALWVAVLFLVVQQLENNLIVPVVMGGNLNLHPVSLIFTILVMHTLFGLVGALLAVPVAAIIKVCWEEFYLKPRGVDPEAMEAQAGKIVAPQRTWFRRRGGAH